MGHQPEESIHTGENEEDDPVHDQDRPEDGDVEDLEPAAYETDQDGAGSSVPELELGQAADERPELFVLLSWQRANGAVLHLAVYRLIGRVELGLEEGEEEIEQVNAESVRNCWRELRLARWDNSSSARRTGSQAWGKGGRNMPMYQPWARRIRRKKMDRRTAVPTHRYATKGVD